MTIYAVILLLMKARAWEPYLLTYCWWVLASLPVQQYGSAASQYDWMMEVLAGEHWKPAGRAANCFFIS